MAFALPDVPEAFRARLAAAAGRIAREGALPAVTGAIAISAEADGATLALAIVQPEGEPTVAVARHAGATVPATRAALDRLCVLIEGLPLVEAAEHGAHHLLDDLRDPDSPAPVPGILTPRNAGAPFRLAERLLRGAVEAWRARGGDVAAENFWNPQLSQSWCARGLAGQAELLKPLLAPAAAEAGLGPDDVWIADIERDTRVVLAFAAGVATAAKPVLLMRLERCMRAATGQRLEVYMEEMKDQNKIRRL